jgi:hypothetical protein
MGLNVTFTPLLTKKERSLGDGLRQRLEQFRRRLAVTDTSVARFVVGGDERRADLQGSLTKAIFAIKPLDAPPSVAVLLVAGIMVIRTRC